MNIEWESFKRTAVGASIIISNIVFPGRVAYAQEDLEPINRIIVECDSFFIEDSETGEEREDRHPILFIQGLNVPSEINYIVSRIGSSRFRQIIYDSATVSHNHYRHLYRREITNPNGQAFPLIAGDTISVEVISDSGEVVNQATQIVPICE